MKWWQRAVFYQIYPRSFADGNGDGIGDFPGITAKLDHLQQLGIDAVWLSPHFPSPFVDCGYDIADFNAVAPEYGTLADFDRFVAEARARGIRVVLDLVLNHSSDQHPWFSASRSDRSDPQRDWYVWRDGKEHGGKGQDGRSGPPNNWVSIFGGPAWTLDARTGQYYYHAFLPQQPDLNWRHPALKQAMWEAVRFWLDCGVDGFRLDAVGCVFEHPGLPDHAATLSAAELLNPNGLPPQQHRTLMQHQLQQPGVHELMKELRALIDAYPGDRVLIGEDEDVAYHGDGDDELQLVFNFPLMRTPRLTPAHVRANQATRLAALGRSWPCNTLGNHDGRRLWSRYGDGVHDAALARLHAALLLTLRGTPVLYNGDEIGMTDLVLDSLDSIRDTAALAQYRLLTGVAGETPQAALAAVIASTRDRCRGPLQWRDAPNGGFCPQGVAPWLPVNADHARGVNVADQQRDPGSLLNLYRRLLALRRATPALVAGDYRALDEGHAEVLSFLRHDAASGQTCLVALNFSGEAQTIDSGAGAAAARLLWSSVDGREPLAALGELRLAPHEALITELAA